MSNDENGGDLTVEWPELPPDARRYVYDYLRQAIAQARLRTSEARLASGVDSALGTGFREFSGVHAAMEVAFEAALMELEAADPNICVECGGFHEPEAPHPHDVS
jgi:hypothetical protein